MTEAQLIERIWTRAYLDTKEKHIELLREFSSQEITEFKTRLKNNIQSMIDIRHKSGLDDDFVVSQCLALQGVLAEIDKM